MSARPWMPLYVADYLADTAHLNAAESGAYLHLIMHYWLNEGLPDDDKQLARIARMTALQWRATKVILADFFHDGWRHHRIDAELARADAKHARRQEAGKRGGIASANAKQNPSNATSNATSNAQASSSESQTDKITELRSAAPADPRTDLFDRGLKTLILITGKTQDSSRSLIGKWLKSVNDEAIHVLAAIQDAERNRVADPVAWINRALIPSQGNRNGKVTIHAAADNLLDKLRALDEGPPGDLRDGAGENPVRRLPAR